MYIQITNTTLSKQNQIQSKKENIGQMVRKQGWKLTDCKFSEIRDELIEATYRGADGKNCIGGQRQYANKAKSLGTLNLKNKLKKKKH